MSRLFYHVMQDNVGNLLFDVSGTMRLAGSATLATIYGDEALTVILPNPMTNHPSFGSFKCFLGAGDYDFHMAKAGYTFETLTGVQGHGTLAQQDANAVTITGGTATLGSLIVDNPTLLVDAALNSVGCGAAPQAGQSLVAETAAVRLALHVGTGGTLPAQGSVQLLRFPKAVHFALVVQPNDNDTGAGGPAQFITTSGGVVGSITTTASATAYNTSSDGRLKEAVEPLQEALATVQALHPVAFRWKADGSPGQGFIAQEAQAVVPQAVWGDPTDPLPTMQMDLSKLVPYLVGAVQTLAQQVQALQAQLALRA